MSSVLLKMDEGWLERAASAVIAGGVVALPYERLFGLAANALDEDAVARVANIKRRPDRASGSKPIAVILPARAALALVAAGFSPAAVRLADRHWPGLLTLLVPAVVSLPRPLVSTAGLVGVRLPGPCPAALLAERTGLVLTATSANRSGGADALSHEHVIDLEGIDFVVQGTVAGEPGSTVVDPNGPSPIVIRQGLVRID